MKQTLNTLLFILIANFTFAQNGTLRGKIYDDATNEICVGAIVKAIGVNGGTISDFEGTYVFSLPPGTYTLTFKYIGLPEYKEYDVVILADKVTVRDVRIVGEVESVLTKGPIVVSGVRKTNTDAAILAEKKNSINAVDGVSAEASKRAGDSDAGQAVARVTGISVQGGKHVFVRGLGDRYTKTILNGMVIPGLDPDKNAVQMDIFPTNVLDNIMVYKTFTPDLPGDFAGGLVDISTKAFPSKKSRSFSASLGYNPTMHLNKDYITYKGSSTDFLAFDNGDRALPISRSIDLTKNQYDPSANNPELTTITKKFSNNLATERKLNAPNTSLSFSQGDQFNKKNGNTLGYNLALNYSLQTEYYEEAIFSSYIKPQEIVQNELLRDKDLKGNMGNSTAAWSILAGGAYKKGNSKYSLSGFRTQNAESRSAFLRQEDYRENPNVQFRSNLEYTQRSVTNFMLSGKHVLDSGKWQLDWKLSPTFSSIDEPDMRLTAFELTDDINPKYAINEAVGAGVTRSFRNLQEQNYNTRIDLEKTMKIAPKRVAKLKFGLLETYKARDYSILDYRIRIQSEGKFSWTGDPNELLADENIWTPAPLGVEDSGSYINGQRQLSNTYSATQNIAAAYIMHEYPFSERLNMIYGARLEQTRNHYTGQNQDGVRLRDSLLLNKTSILPSVNFIYKVTPKTNARFTYARTVARPSFKELSNAEIVDRISGRTFLGNDTLTQTSIDNIDLRYESFLKGGQLLSVSPFYKRFTDPIELVAYNSQNPNNFQPRNVGTANVYGVELEAKLLIDIFSDTNAITTFGSNVTLVKSSVEMTVAERLGRISAARVGEVIGTNRDMVGQSPYIVNAYINYTNLKSKWDATFTYNVQGPRLSVVGVARNPDVYEMPFHSLNFKASKASGKNDQWKWSLTANNIMGSERYFEYVSYGAENQLFSSLKPMRTFSIGVSYTL